MTTQCLLDSKAAAERLGVSKRTVEDWRMRGMGPRFRKHGGRVYYTPETLDAWSDNQERQSTSEAAA